MANLLSWLGNTAKNVEKNVGNFIGGAERGVQRNIVNPVVNQVRQAPQQIAQQAVRSLPVVRQVADINQSLTNAYENLPRVQQQQVNQKLQQFSNTIKPISSIAEANNQSFLAGGGRDLTNLAALGAKISPVNLAVDALTHGQGTKMIDQASQGAKQTFFPEPGKKNSLSPTKLQDYTPAMKKARLAGSIEKAGSEQAALMALSGGAGNAASGAASSLPLGEGLAAQVIPKIASGVASGATFGGLQGALDGKSVPGTLKQAAGWGVAGGVGGAVVPLIPNVGNIPFVRAIPRALGGAAAGAITAPLAGMTPEQGAAFGLLGGSEHPYATTNVRTNGKLPKLPSTEQPRNQGKYAEKPVVPGADIKKSGGTQRLLNQAEMDHYAKTGNIPANADGYVNLAKPGQLGDVKGVTPDRTYLVTFKDGLPIDSQAGPQVAIKGQINRKHVASIEPYVPPTTAESLMQAEKAAQLKRSWIPDEGGYISLGKKQSPTEAYIKEQTALQEAAAKGGKDGKLTAARKELATKGLDALTPIEKPVEIAAGGRKETVALRNQLDRSLRSDTIAGQYARDNGLHTVINSVDDTKAFDQYLLARHAQDLQANGIKTGRDAIKDKRLLAELGPKYEAQAQAITKYNSDLLDKTVDYGLISRETADYLKKKYPNYVPFDRIFADGEINGRGSGAGVASLSTQSVIQRIKGSERQIHSPLESILAKTHDVIAQGERNRAAQAIVDTMKLPSNPLSLRELKPSETIGAKSVISFLDNGQKRVFETTPEVAQAAKSLNKQQLGLVGQILAFPTRVLRLGATGVNAGFALANVAKDAASAFINSEHGLRSSVANPKVFLEALSAAGHHNSKAYGELVREGAGGTSFDIARNSAKDTISKIRSERNAGTKIAYTVTHPGELLRAVEDTIGRSEEFGRAMQYYGNKQAALAEGKGLSEAIAYGADAARNNTVNFARAGEYGRVVNSVLPYLNAGVQGSRTLLRNLRDRPVQTASKIAITAFLPVAATTAWNLNDPKRKQAYDDIQEYEKQGNIIIIPPNPVKDTKTGRWNVIKVPVSQEIANLNNIVRNGVESLHGDKNFNFAEMAANLFGTATSLNAQSPRQLAGQLTPQAVKPGVEALTNQNLFTGNPIVPDSKKLLEPADQYGKGTSGTARVIGRNIGIAPYQIDNFIKTSAGGAGQTAVNASDNLLAKAGVITPDDIRGTSVGKSITNRFNTAAGQPEYAPIDKALSDKVKQFQALPGYKALSPEDKAKALNRLKNDVIVSTKRAVDAKNQTGPYAPGNTENPKKLSARQAGLLDGKTDISSYLTSQADNPTASNPKDRYQQALDAYNSDKKAGRISDVQDMKKQSELNRLKAQANSSQDAVDLYGQSYKNIVSFVTKNKNGSKLWEEVKALDKAMVDAGYTSKLYNKNGSLKATVAKGSSGKKAKKGRVVKLPKFNITGKTAFHVKKVSAPKVAKLPVSKLPKIKINKLIA